MSDIIVFIETESSLELREQLRRLHQLARTEIKAQSHYGCMLRMFAILIDSQTDWFDLFPEAVKQEIITRLQNSDISSALNYIYTEFTPLLVTLDDEPILAQLITSMLYRKLCEITSQPTSDDEMRAFEVLNVFEDADLVYTE